MYCNSLQWHWILYVMKMILNLEWISYWTLPLTTMCMSCVRQLAWMSNVSGDECLHEWWKTSLTTDGFESRDIIFSSLNFVNVVNIVILWQLIYGEYAGCRSDVQFHRPVSYEVSSLFSETFPLFDRSVYRNYYTVCSHMPLFASHN